MPLPKPPVRAFVVLACVLGAPIEAMAQTYQALENVESERCLDVP